MYIIKNINGKLSFEFSQSKKQMPDTAFYEMFAACSGDFSFLDDKTRDAMIVKGMEISSKCIKSIKDKSYRRQEQSQKIHNKIISEIRTLMCNKDSFTIAEVQLAALNCNNSFPVRTRQMYGYHLNKECNQTIERITDNCIPVYLDVILRNGKRGRQSIPRSNRCNTYRFIK